MNFQVSLKAAQFLTVSTVGLPQGFSTVVVFVSCFCSNASSMYGTGALSYTAFDKNIND
jgi:hypothetical protein